MGQKFVVKNVSKTQKIAVKNVSETQKFVVKNVNTDKSSLYILEGRDIIYVYGRGKGQMEVRRCIEKQLKNCIVGKRVNVASR